LGHGISTYEKCPKSALIKILANGRFGSSLCENSKTA
jgi:hypothetical protein